MTISQVDSRLDSAAALLVEELIDKLQAGDADVEAFIGAHPEHAERLRRLLPALRVMADLSNSLEEGQGCVDGDAVQLGTLGDFRIVREIGRGGMGVVYEAEQLSLRRQVALKVLPLAATMDPRHLQRFHNEAQAAACLHHGHIVPVFYVGCERGVHFYAMQLIEGQTLAAVIRELRWDQNEPEALATGRGRAPEAGVELAGEGEPLTVPHVHRPAPPAETLTRASLSTEGTRRGKEYYRKVAELGIQAAQALDYAHERGVIHRDVKPGNLMLDGHGALWVTDFGLAHLQHAEGSLTITGDLLGTLRYMSPEQAMGKRVVVDHRTDVYSLGMTMYELLALRPAFEGSDRQELLRQVTFEDPKAPRKLDWGIPPELETIVLKAMEKNPVDRYGTAKEMADDLRRFLEDRPVTARRPSLRQVVVKWSRRHRAAVRAIMVVLMVLAVVGGANGVWWLQKCARAEGEARVALDEALLLRRSEKWTEALSAVKRAHGVLVGVWADDDLRKQVYKTEEDLEMARRLEEANLRMMDLNLSVDKETAHSDYVHAFQSYGMDIDNLDALAAGELIRASSIQPQLAEALHHWTYLRLMLGIGGWRHLLAVAHAGDPDPWRDRLRDVVESGDPKAMQEVSIAAARAEVPLATAVLLVLVMHETTAPENILLCLQRIQQRNPANFWLNLELARGFRRLAPPRLEEAVRYCTAAVALRPLSPAAHNNLGIVLAQKGRWDEAIAEFREAIRLDGNDGSAHCNLANALQNKGLLDEAVEACREAIRLDPRHAGPRYTLGNLLLNKDKPDQAIKAYRDALGLDEAGANIHAGLANALWTKGLLREAIAEYREAIKLANNDYPEAQRSLCKVLLANGQSEEAAAECRQAIKRGKDDAQNYYNLASVLTKKGRLDEAIAEYQRAISLKEDFAEAYCDLGKAHEKKGEFRQAVDALRRGHQLGKREQHWRHPSLQWLTHAEKLVQVNNRLSAVLNGTAQPKDARERIAFAELCQNYHKRYTAAVQFYREAFSAEPRLADRHRYNAACAAVLAGCGQGKDADQNNPEKRVDLRCQSLDWLSADIAAWNTRMKTDPDKIGAIVIQQMRHWLHDADFAGVRGTEALARLPESERAQWQKLWAAVAQTMETAKEKIPAKDKAIKKP
jgi:serine/threonine protein kinase/Flp pilus assembly protein TadD